MRHRTIASLAVSCALAACAHQQAPSAAGGMRWAFFAPGAAEGAKLAFGKPDTDDVPVMMTCRPRSGQVEVWLSGPAVGSSLTVSSGDRTARLAARSSGEGYEGLIASMPAGDGVLTRFAQTGLIGVSADGARGPFPADRDRAAKFVASCRA